MGVNHTCQSQDISVSLFVVSVYPSLHASRVFVAILVQGFIFSPVDKPWSGLSLSTPCLCLIRRPFSPHFLNATQCQSNLGVLSPQGHEQRQHVNKQCICFAICRSHQPGRIDGRVRRYSHFIETLCADNWQMSKLYTNRTIVIGEGEKDISERAATEMTLMP